MHRLFLFVCGLLLAASTLPPSVSISSAQHAAQTLETAQLLERTDRPSLFERRQQQMRQQQMHQQQISPQTPAPPAMTPGVVFAKHCNGTCACTGKDCSRAWIEANCKDGKATCSGTASSGDDEGVMCSCIKKVAH